MADATGGVVLVDDDMGIKQAMERVLSAAGFAVTSFDSAEDALNDRTTFDAGCLVLDIHLPGISGFELFDRLIAVGRKRPVVFITGRDDPLHSLRAEKLGAIGYLVKPFSGRDLSALVGQALA
jgi:two-component system response regulator TtrR